jgi:putative endonuclease
MKTIAQRLGRWGEDLAAGYLRQNGYAILDQNARTPYGEIDLVARHEITAGPTGINSLTVFVEVKTRRSSSFGMPEAAVTAKKQEHLLAACQAYLQAHPELDGTWRIDVIAIRQSRPDVPAEIVHFENAINSQ